MRGSQRVQHAFRRRFRRIKRQIVAAQVDLDVERSCGLERFGCFQYPAPPSGSPGTRVVFRFRALRSRNMRIGADSEY